MLHFTKRSTALALTAALALAGLGVTAGAAGASTATAPATTCALDRWPAATNGSPGRSPGVAVFHDANGWHVRVTHNALHDRVFSGTVTTTGSLVAVSGYKLERNDTLKVGSGGHTIVFRFNNYGATDGFDFRTQCAPALAFGFLTDGHVVPPVRIAVGAAGRHPASDPFVIRRAA